MSECIVYITAESQEEAEIIGRHLVSRKLAACVNILGDIKSIYHWEGSIEESSEVVLIAKTKDALIDELTENVRSIHSYDCPCIVSMPVSGGSTEYINWIRNETK